MGGLKDQVNELSQYLDDEAIARALKLTPEAVQDIREGRAEISEPEGETAHAPVIVSSVKTAFRQKIIAVCRAKGGVGCTVITVGLAMLLSREMKALLIDFNLAEGGGDISWFLNLPEFPHMGAAKNLDDCVIRLEPNFHVLQAPAHVSAERERAEEIILWARQDYDAVVMDLPNHYGKLTAKALQHSNTIVVVTSGLDLEVIRLGMLLYGYRTKDTIIVPNRGQLPKEAEETFSYARIARVENDPALLDTFKRCDLPSAKSPFMQGVGKIKDVIYGQPKKGLLSLLG